MNKCMGVSGEQVVQMVEAQRERVIVKWDDATRGLGC